ncbi:MAG: OmpH family outer membrane protein [Bacteroides sp.]|nr:OmpH family outer membrane protein [Bacteroides sp.]
MLKKIALLLALMIPVGLFAQNVKFGHVNSEEILVVMPEFIKAKADVEKLAKQLEDELKRTQEELNKKYNELQQAIAEKSIPDNIAERRTKEIREMVDRQDAFKQEAGDQIRKAQQEAMLPIQKKLNDAIVAVGKAENVVYVFDLSVTPIPYINEALSIDLTNKVKAHLGIK